MSTNTNQTEVFLDNLGRTILGTVTKATDNVFTVKNPVILNVVPLENGKMTLQLFPLYFKEFLADKSEDIYFDYQLSQITRSSIKAVDFRLAGQYAQMFSQPQQQATENSEKAGVVNLFDEKNEQSQN